MKQSVQKVRWQSVSTTGGFLCLQALGSSVEAVEAEEAMEHMVDR